MANNSKNGRVYGVFFVGPSNRYIRYSLLRQDALSKVLRGASVRETSYWAGAQVPGARLAATPDNGGYDCEVCQDRRCGGHNA